jgi:tetratricopeptide (TPR) repeat protein
MRTPRVVLALAPAALVLACAQPLLAQSVPDAYFDFLNGLRLEGAGDMGGAQASFERAATEDPQSAEARAELAAFHLRRESFDAAEKVAQQALALDDSNSQAHRVLGLLYAARSEESARAQSTQVAARQVRDAIDHLEKVDQNPAALPDIELQYRLGLLYTRSGQVDKAISALSRVVAENPRFAQGRLDLAQAYLVARDIGSAIATLAEVVDDDPRVAATLGRLQEQAGRPKEAAESYTKALSVAPNSRDLKVRRIAALTAAKDYATAASFAGQAQEQHPGDLRFPQFRAHAMLQMGDAPGAITVLEPVARGNPNDAATQLSLADLYSTAGRKNEAERTVRQLITLEPGNADALNYLGYLLADRGQQLDEAIRLVRRALDLEPDNPNYLDSLGWAYFRRGDLDQAERYLAPAAQQLPRNSTIQDHMGDVLAKRGRWQDAIAAWTRALETADSDTSKATLEKKIADARGKTR